MRKSPEKLSLAYFRRTALATLFHSERLKRGITVSALARTAGVRRTTYQHYEAATAEPSLSVGLLIMEALEITPNQVLERLSSGQ